MVYELGNNFRVCVRLKSMASLFQKCFNVLVIGYDAVVHNDKGMFHIGALWMGINFAWYTMGGPSCVSDANMNIDWFIFSFNCGVVLNWTVDGNLKK